MKLFPLVILFFLVPAEIFAQDDLMNLLDQNDPKQINFTTATFKSTRILNGHSIEKMPPGQLDFRISPTYVHRNLVATEFDPNDLLSIGAGGRMKLSKRVSLNAEYYYLANPNTYMSQKVYNPLSVGFDIETGGHVFQLLFTNSLAMIEKGFIGFYSHTPMEDIKADNNQVAGVLDISTGEMVFQALIKSFHFERALMEEHFNENYMESDKYPKASFKGKITNISAVNFSKNGTYEVTVEGDLTIHNTTNKITTKGTIEVVTGGINANSKFNIVPEDYKISIPGVVRDKIDKNLSVTVTMKYSPLENK